MNKNIYLNETNNENYQEFFKFLGILVTIIAFIGLIFLIFKTKEFLSNKPKKEVIQYEKILAKDSFKQSENNYYVLFYNILKDEDKKIQNMVSKYQEQKRLKLYIVDTSLVLNKDYVANEHPSIKTTIDKLKVTENTLIEIRDGQVSNFYNGEEINNHLS